MRKSNGITLTYLVIAIIILLILASVSIKISFNGIDKILDSNYQIELEKVRIAVMEQYTKAVSTNNTYKPNSIEQVRYFVGKRLDKFEDEYLPIKDNVSTNGASEIFYYKIQNYPMNCIYQEDYYYLLEPNDLEKIGIYNSNYCFIVNYKTGEAYNMSEKVNSKLELLYLPETMEQTKNEDDLNCNDWT